MDTGQFGVILEDIREMFRTLGDGQQAVVERMDRLENRMGRLENRMDKLDWRQGQVEDALHTVIKQLAFAENKFEAQSQEHEARISRLEAEVGIG